METEALIPTVQDPEHETAVALIGSVRGLGVRVLSWLAKDLEPDLQAATNALQAVRACEIRTPEDRTALLEIVAKVKGDAKAVEDKRTRFAIPLNTMFKSVNAEAAKVSALFEQAETDGKKKCLAWDAKVKAEQDRLRREAEEKARKEQARLDRIAEENARKAEAKGNIEKAEAIRQTVPQVPIQTPLFDVAPKINGESTRKTWKARVPEETLGEFYTGIGCGIIPTHMASPNLTELSRACPRPPADPWPGVVIEEVPVLAVGAK